jgi:hypothetical protein
VIDPWSLRLVLLELTGWLERREREGIAYLVEENRCLRRQLGSRRLRLTNDDRRRLAARAHRVGRAVLREVATIATPDTSDGLPTQTASASCSVRTAEAASNWSAESK